MAPFMTPSCSSLSTIVVSISQKPRSRGARTALRPYNESTCKTCRRCNGQAAARNTALQIRLVCPFTVDYLDDDARALVKAGVIGGGHGEHPLRCRQAFDLLAGIAHGLAEFSRAWLCTCFQCMRSEEHTSELQSLIRISYAVFCLTQNNIHQHIH